MAANINNGKSQKERMLFRVAALYLEGKKQQEIADIIGCHRSQISRYMKIITERWKEETTVNIELSRRLEVERINSLEDLARSEWTETGQSKWIRIILQCIKMRIKILGLDAPKKLEIEAIPPSQELNHSKMTIDEIEERLEEYDQY